MLLLNGACGIIGDKCSVSLSLRPQLVDENESEDYKQLIESADVERIIYEVKAELGYDLAKAVEIAAYKSVNSNFDDELTAAMRENSLKIFMDGLLNMSLAYSRKEEYLVTPDVFNRVFDETIPAFFKEACLHVDAMTLFKKKFLMHCKGIV